MKKTLLLLVLILLAASPLVGQAPPGGPGGPPPGPGPNPQGPPPDVVLRELLGFSDAQLTALHTLGQARQQAVEALQPQIADAERALGEALKATTPDPLAVGTALLRLEGLRKQHQPIDEAFKTGFANLLTPEQKARVQAMKDVDAAIRGGEALRRIGAF
jgi:Spy/CpxP family protein refolding chaperone